MALQWKQSGNGLLAGLAVLVGWWAYGWQGLLFAISVVVFWMLVEFGRANRALQRAAQRPVGHLDSAVMFQARLNHGMTMQEVIALAGSLGRKVGERDEWEWADASGNEVVVTFRRGVVIRWAIARNEVADDDTTAPDQPNRQM